MLTRIVVPLDGSPLAEQALGPATAIARRCGASLDLVLVHAPFPLQNLHNIPWGGAQWDASARYLGSLADEIHSGAGVEASHCLRKGEPVRNICDRAADIDADLIVMTSHGRTGLSRVWFGSVADGVMRHADVPVLIVRPIAGTSRRHPARPLCKHVLVPLDGFSTEIVPAAIELAKCDNAKMTLLRVVQPIPLISVDLGTPYPALGGAWDDDATKAIAETTRQHLETLAERLSDETGLEVEPRVIVDSSVATAIVELARAEEMDLIAMASHSGPVSRFFLGSVADKVIRAANTPVLLYKPEHVRASRNAEHVDMPIREFSMV
jgi:nucleotide-binding universal stress UspA family protein